MCPRTEPHTSHDDIVRRQRVCLFRCLENLCLCECVRCVCLFVSHPLHQRLSPPSYEALEQLLYTGKQAWSNALCFKAFFLHSLFLLLPPLHCLASKAYRAMLYAYIPLEKMLYAGKQAWSNALCFVCVCVCVCERE
jgi:hypothetical protein